MNALIQVKAEADGNSGSACDDACMEEDDISSGCSSRGGGKVAGANTDTSTSAGRGTSNAGATSKKHHRNANRQRGRPKGSKKGDRTAPTESFTCITADQINPHDVLCGRGKDVTSNAGNTRFLAFVETRKADYASAETHGEKNVIAEEVCRYVRSEVVPNGRFLKRATKEQAACWGFESNAEVWVPVVEGTMMDKIRQALREKEYGKTTTPWIWQELRQRQASDALASYEAVAGATLFPLLTSSNVATSSTHPIQAHASAAGMGLLATSLPPSSTGLGPPTSVFLNSKGQVAVKDWINAEMVKAMSLHGGDVHAADRSYLLNAASLSLALMKTVDLYHRNNIAFGGSAITTDAIRITKQHFDASSGVAFVHPNSEVVSEPYFYVIGITGLTSQSPLPSSTFADDVRVDLFNVGAVLYEIFSGVPPFQNKEVDSADSPVSVPSKKQRGGMPVADSGSPSRSCIPLRDLGMPVAIDALVSQMMGQGESSQYESAGNVVEVLQYMVNGPESFLFDIDSEEGQAVNPMQNGYKLIISKDKLYGRKKDIDLLDEIFSRTIRSGGSAEVVLVSGYSGVGKSSLVLQFRQSTIDLGGFFVSGKFDTLRQARPLSAIVAALDAFCDDLISQKDESRFSPVQTAIKEVIGDGGTVLTKLIPNLSKVIMENKGGAAGDLCAADIDMEEVDFKGLHRLVFLMKRFFRAISSTMSVLLFLDDLQWADSASLELIKAIVCEGNMKSFLFVGACRSNDICGNHVLSELKKISDAGISVQRIVLDNMDKNSVNALISDTLKLSPLMTRPLADVVYSKTSGNCLFVVEFLADLYRQGLLRWSVSSRRYEWDGTSINSLEINKNVVDLMRRKMLRLGATEMWSLKIAACLGAQTKSTTLNLLSKGLGLAPENGLVTLLQEPIAEGLLLKVGTSICFSHDQIQQAAYSLISNADKPSLHLKIGRSLCKVAKGEAANKMIFTCVDQLNRGFSEIKLQSEKRSVAFINLHAAKKAIASSTFLAASIYLKLAVKCLEEKDWETDYDLCLEIYSSLSETEYVVGQYEDMIVVLNEVLLRARTFEDKLRAYYTLTSASGAMNDLKTAISTGFEVLDQLGEPFEENVDFDTVMKDIAYTKGMLESKGEDWFMNHHLMTDKKKLFVMRLLNLMTMYVYLSDAMKVPLVSCRLIQLSILYGLCKESSYGFSMYGLICSGFLGEYAEGYRMGKIGMAVLDKFYAHDIVARVYAINYGLVNVWTEPLQATLPQLLVGHNAGLAGGVPEFACVNMHIYLVSAFQSGQPLQDLANDAAELIKECDQYEQEQMKALITPVWQCVLNLIGDAGQEDPTKLNGRAMQEDEFLLKQMERENRSAICYLYYSRLVLAYLFGRYNVAAHIYDKCLEADLEKNLMSKFENCICAFYGSLTALALQRRVGEDPDLKLNDIVETVMSRMETWAKASAWNCEHKLQLLKAEKMANAGNSAGAAEAYQKAINLSREHGFIQEYAMSSERYGDFLLASGDEKSSRYHYDNAYKAYLKWGALRKSADIRGDFGGNY